MMIDDFYYLLFTVAVSLFWFLRGINKVIFYGLN